MEDIPHENFSEEVESHHKTTDDNLPREFAPPLSQSCEKITEADQEDCSLIVDENQKATLNNTPHSSADGRRKLDTD